jgi:hypothetical protein
MTRRTTHTTTIQCWPGGQSFTYRGDLDGPENQRSLRAAYSSSAALNPWRKGTPEEWRTIRIATRAERYGQREILCCDSSLVDDLVKAANQGSLNGDRDTRELGRAFEYDQIENLYKDPADWDADQCREYLSDEGIDAPGEVRQTSCEHCGQDIENTAPFPDGQWRDRGSNTHCPNPAGDAGQVHAPETHPDDEDQYLDELRDACRDHAQDHPAEVYEWWRVSSWLCAELRKIGEVVIDNGYGQWWGRTCTGQGWIMDGTLQTIAAQYEQDEVTV